MTLVAEVAHAGKEHGHVFFVGGLDHLLIPYGSTRFHYGRNPCSGGGINRVTFKRNGQVSNLAQARTNIFYYALNGEV